MVNVGTSIATPVPQHLDPPDSMPLTNMSITQTITPPMANVTTPSSQCMLERAQNVRDELAIAKVQA